MKRLKKSLSLLLILTLLVASAMPVIAEEGHHMHPGVVYVTGDVNGATVTVGWTSDPATSFEDVAYRKLSGNAQGITYDRATNTVNLTNFNYPDFQMEMSNMGADFKINLTGTNKIGQILAMGSGGNCTITFTGEGTLTLNEKKEDPEGFMFSPYGSDSTLDVKGNATVTAYAGVEKETGKVTGTALSVYEGKKDCIKAKTDQALKVSPISTPTYFDVITNINDDPEYSVSVNSYYKKGNQKDLYSIEESFNEVMQESTWTISRLHKLPGQDYYARVFGSPEYEEPIGYEPTGNVVYTYSTSSMGTSACEKDGKKYYYTQTYIDADKVIKIQIIPIEKFADYTIENYDGSTGTRDVCMAGTPLDTTYTCTAWEEVEKTLENNGYKMIGTETGFYKMNSTGASITLTAAAAAPAPTTAPTAAPTPTPTAAPTPVANKKAVKASDGNKVTTTSKGEATITEVKKTTKKSVTVKSTTKVDGVEYTVTTINKNAFKNATKATTVTLPNTITKINANAFAKSKIKTVNITVKNVSKLTINTKAFKGSNVKNVTVTVSKKMSKKDQKALKKKLTKAGIKEKNIKIRKK